MIKNLESTSVELIQARLRELRLPVVNPVAGADRIWFTCTPEFRARLAELVAGGTFRKWPLSLTQPTHGQTAVESYRETRWRDSMQLVIHNKWLNVLVVEADIDGFNPDGGILPAALHLWQVAVGAVKGWLA